MLKRIVKTTMEFFIKTVEVIMTAMLVIMMLSLLWQVFTRFIIKVPSVWTEEIARYSFIYMTMLGAALGVRYSQHFGMTMVVDKFSKKFRKKYDRYFINGVIMLAAMFMLYYGLEYTFTLGMVRVSPTFLVPMAWVFMSIPISGFLMMIFSIYNMVFGNYEPVNEIENDIEDEIEEQAILTNGL